MKSDRVTLRQAEPESVLPPTRAFGLPNVLDAVVPAAIVALATAALRARTFMLPVADGDVGTYVLVARELLHGTLPYVQTWEYKPPLLFAIYALALALFRNVDLAVAILGLLAVVVTAWLLLAIARRCDPIRGTTAGTIAALVYAMLSTENDGLTSDAELLVVPFTVAGFLVLGFARSPLRALGGGLLFAGAVQMKLTALPVALLGAVLAGVWSPLAVVMLTLPFALEAALYARAGALALFLDANIGATVRRLTSPHGGGDALRAGLVQLRVLAPAIELALLAPFTRLPLPWWVWTWAALGFASAVAVGSGDARLFLECSAPIALIAAFALVARTRAPRTAIALVLLATFALHGFDLTRRTLVAVQRGVPSQHVDRVGDALARALRPHERLFILDETPLLYLRAGVAPPTRYAFSPNLLDRRLWPMLGFPGDREIARVLRTCPTLVALGAPDRKDDPATRAMIERILARDYWLYERIETTSLYLTSATGRCSDTSGG